MTKATVEDLGELHGLLCQWGKDKLQELEPINQMTPEGPVTVGYKKAAKASDFAAIAKFLNDNNISADAKVNQGLGALDKELKERKRHSDNVVALADPAAAAAQVREMRNA